MMPTNAAKKAARELDVFTRFISISGMPIDRASVQNCDPPMPDILCKHALDGPLAFELAELVNHDFKARLGRQCKLQNSMETFHSQLPHIVKHPFDHCFRNASLHFRFSSTCSVNQILSRLNEVFSELSMVSETFEGDICSFQSNSVTQIIDSVSISRGEFNGPAFGVDNFGGVGENIVPTINRKLSKTYNADCPIELVGYLDIAGVFPRELRQGNARMYIEKLKTLGPFRRIWIVNLVKNTVEIVRPLS